MTVLLFGFNPMPFSMADHGAIQFNIQGTIAQIFRYIGRQRRERSTDDLVSLVKILEIEQVVDQHTDRSQGIVICHPNVLTTDLQRQSHLTRRPL